MDKLFFCSRYFIGKNKDTLSNKFSNQIEALINLGFDVYYIAFDDTHVALYKGKEKTRNLAEIKEYKNSFINSYINYKNLYMASKQTLALIDNIKYMYVRSIFPIASGVGLLKTAKKLGIINIMEIPTYPSIGEFELQKNPIKKLFLKYLYKREIIYKDYVDLYTVIGESIKTYNFKPALNITNGVATNKYRLKQNSNNEEINILALASMSTWHGFDRLIHGLSKFKGSDDIIKLHFVGSDGDGSLAQWQNLTKELGLENSVIFHGPLYSDDLDEIFDKCDVAVASLGLHRINISRSYVLKIREYVVRGIPFIYACEDPDISSDFAYAKQVSNDESPIDIYELVDFAKKFKGNSNVAKEMHEYAINNLSWEKQFNNVFNYISSMK